MQQLIYYFLLDFINASIRTIALGTTWKEQKNASLDRNHTLQLITLSFWAKLYAIYQNSGHSNRRCGHIGTLSKPVIARWQRDIRSYTQSRRTSARGGSQAFSPSSQARLSSHLLLICQLNSYPRRMSPLYRWSARRIWAASQRLCISTSVAGSSSRGKLYRFRIHGDRCL